MSGANVSVALSLLYLVLMTIIAILMIGTLWRRRPWGRLPRAFLAFVAVVGLMHGLNVGSLARIEWSAQFLINRVVSAAWVLICAQLGFVLLGGDFRATALGKCGGTRPSDARFDGAVLRSARNGILYGGALVAWSVLVFSAGDALGVSDAIVVAADLGALVLVMVGAIAEEVVFRLGLQTFFANWLLSTRRRATESILLSSAIFTLAHTATFDNIFVKYAQIFPVSCVLGILFQRWGLTCAALAHLVMNLGLNYAYAG